MSRRSLQVKSVCFRLISKRTTLFMVVLIALIQENQYVSTHDQISQSISSTGSIKIEEPLISDPQNVSLSNEMLKVFERANNIRIYHLDLHYYRDEVKGWGDPEFINNTNLDHQAICSRHLSEYDRLLRSFMSNDPIENTNSPDALDLANTFGRPESGFTTGNQFWLGSYYDCLRYVHKASDLTEDNQTELIKGQYCIGVVQFPDWNPEHTLTSIKIGMCLPETCTTTMLNEDPNRFEMVNRMLMSNIRHGGPFDKLELRHIHCIPHETSRIRQITSSGQAFIGLMGIMILLCLIATLSEYLIQDRTNYKLLIFIDSFSINRNMRKFFHIREDDSNNLEVDKFSKSDFFNVMAGLKSLGLIWVIAAHTLMIAPTLTQNLPFIDELSDTFISDLHLAAHLMVDTFFVLSGVIAAYLIFQEGIEKIKTKQWIQLTIHRYWRLSSIYFLSFWFAKSLGPMIGSGPMWDYGITRSSYRVICARESWLEAIFYLSDFKAPKEHCIPFAWFIANSIKFWLLTPFLLVLISKSIRMGYSFIIMVIVANSLLVYRLAGGIDIDLGSLVEMKPEAAENLLNNMDRVYTRPYARIGTYLVGLLAGHLMYMSDTQRIKINLSNKKKYICWILFIGTFLSLTFMMKIFGYLNLSKDGMRAGFNYGSALMRPLWALCVCWLLYALSHGQARLLKRFLAAKSWRLLTKLSFAAHLLQGEILTMISFGLPSTFKFTYMDVISKSLLVVTLLIAVCFPVVIFIEYPLEGIERLVLPTKRAKSIQFISRKNIQTSSKVEGDKPKKT